MILPDFLSFIFFTETPVDNLLLQPLNLSGDWEPHNTKGPSINMISKKH